MLSAQVSRRFTKCQASDRYSPVGGGSARCKHWIAGRNQGLDEQPPVGFDPHHHPDRCANHSCAPLSAGG